MKLKRVILISSFVVMCVSAALAQVSQIGVESLYQGITSADAAITAQMFALNGFPESTTWSRNIAECSSDYADSKMIYYK